MSAVALVQPVRTIRLYGKLGARFGRVHRMAVSSAAEAIRALGSQIRGFDAYLTQSKDNGLGYAVFYGKNNLSEGELAYPAGKEEIRIAPILLGAKNGGVFQIILGAVLVIVGTILEPYTAGLSTALVTMGYGMIVGGVVQLLTPMPKGRSSQDKADNTPSYSFNGPINTQAQGNCVPVLYGELIVGSAVVSASINTTDGNYVPDDTVPNGYGGGGGGGAPRWRLDWEGA